MKRPLPVHPILLALAPVLFAYAHNVRSIPIPAGELILPIIVTLGLSLGLWALLGLILRNGTKAALVASLFMLLFFLYGHVQAALHIQGPQQGILAVAAIIVIAVGAVLVLRARGNLFGLTSALNVAGLALVLLNVLAAFPGLIRQEAGRAPIQRRAVGSATSCPDIYYIILDAYLRSDYLKSNHHVDNSDFLQDLEHNGFMVVSRARCNYRYTYASLASSLNFTYLDSLAQAQGPSSVDMAPLIHMIEESRVAAFLKRQGYRIVTFASGHTGTELRNADVRLAPFGQLTEFQNMVLSTTMLAGLVEFIGTGWADQMHARLVRYTLKTIPRAGQGRHPAFVFAHVVSPHSPHVFDAQGNPPKHAGGISRNPKRTDRAENRGQPRAGRVTSYGAQVQYLNVLLGETVERILADSTRPAVIILQADHGPILLPGQFAVLNVIRVPPAVVRHPEAPAFYDSITPVNTFRVLLSQLFDTSMALLPDQSYFCPLGSPYDFHVVEQPEESRLRTESRIPR